MNMEQDLRVESKSLGLEERPYLSEKELESGVETPASSVNGPDWTVEEEKRLVRKIDLILMPLLILPFYALQLDRGNIGNALTDFFLQEVGITQNQFNVGQQLLSLGIVLLEIPSNLVLYRVGPQAWISCQIFAWGLVALFQAFQSGLAAFLVTRLLLGLCESGFIPAGLYAITTWYKTSEISRRFALYFFGNFFAQASSGLLAYGILHMRGICGLSGWQWLFIIEGIFTVSVGIVYIAFFPKDRENPRTLTGIHYFSERERYILPRRIVLDDPTKARGARKTVSMKELCTTLSDWKLYPHILMTIAAMAPVQTLNSYAPTLVKSFGYGRLTANALVSIGYWILLFMMQVWGYVADKVKNRGIPTLVALTLWWGFALGNRIVTDDKKAGTRLALLTLSIAFSQICHPMNTSWVAINSRSPPERTIRLAAMIMAANTAGIVGSQIFQEQDGPLYHTGWTVMVCLISFGLLCTLFTNVQYRVVNRRMERKGIVGWRPFHL